jgi:hypothetical protein
MDSRTRDPVPTTVHQMVRIEANQSFALASYCLFMSLERLR